VRRPLDVFALALEPLLFALALLTALLTRRTLGRSHLLLVAVILATVLPYLFLHFEPRYVQPASFAYLLWIALGLDLLIERRRRSRLGELSAVRLPTENPGAGLEPAIR
jgi:hypothetical protein